jgi:hypothetical protein
MKWNHCLQNAVNGMIYGESVYLDTMAVHWDAIVWGDYEAVMPLTWKKKWSIRYLYQPPFLQQGGIYAIQPLSNTLLSAFLNLAAKHFSFAETTLNHGNLCRQWPDGIAMQKRSNYLIHLEKGYEEIYKNYHQDTRQSIQKALDANLQYSDSTAISPAIRLYEERYRERLPAFKPDAYNRFEKLCKHYSQQNRVIVRQVKEPENGELIAVSLLLKDDKRFYNLISCTVPEGRKKKANYFLYDALIREWAGTSMILDLEGSDVPGIAFFYQKLGAKGENYPFIRFNLLPRPVRLFKR